MFGFGKKSWVEWFKLGVSCDDAGNYDKAINAFQQVLIVNPEHFGACLNLGLIYLKTAQFAKAIDTLQRAVRINSDESAVWDSLGTAYGSAGQFPKAIAAFKEAIRINPNDAQAWGNLAETYAATGDFTKANLCLLWVLPTEAGANSVISTPSASIQTKSPVSPSSNESSLRCSRCGNLTIVPRGSTRACDHCGINAPLLTAHDQVRRPLPVLSPSQPSKNTHIEPAHHFKRKWRLSSEGLLHTVSGELIPTKCLNQVGGFTPGFEVREPRFSAAWISMHEIQE